MTRALGSLSRPGAAAGAVGLVILAQLALAAALGRATTEAVWFAGQELDTACSFRQRFGVPCPNCGMTRSVLLSLHGDLASALAVNPAGPLLVLGAILFAAAMFFLMAYQRWRPAAAVERARRSILFGSLAYAGLFLAVLVGHWVRAIF